MNLGPQMADISKDNQRANFNTGLFKLPQIRPRAKKLLVASENMDKQARFMYHKYRLFDTFPTRKQILLFFLILCQLFNIWK